MFYHEDTKGKGELNSVTFSVSSVTPWFLIFVLIVGLCSCRSE